MATKSLSVASAVPTSKPGAPRPRPYKDFLTPALHRSFTNAALIGLALCWIEAILMAKPSLFWSWFPLGFTGIRAGLLFISSLTIFILRVAQLRVGTQTHSSSLATLCDISLYKRTFSTAIWYWVSAFLFSETYIFSTAQTANLSWVDPGRSYERPRLNERAVLLRTMFSILAVAQAIVHVYRDYDSLEIPYPKSSRSDRRHKPDAPSESSQDARGVPEPLLKMQRQLLPLAIRSLIMTLLVGIWGPIIYFLLLRQTAWSVARTVGRMFFTINKSQTPSGLSDIPSLWLRFFTSALLLVLLWEITNFAFTVFAGQMPLKKGQPLTNDSKNPNGSLVNGLKAKREIPHSMALWELRLIAEQFEVRRRTIFNDFEKPGTSTWLDVVTTCLSEVEAIPLRIKASQSAGTTPPSSAAIDPSASKSRLTQPLNNDPKIFRPSPRPSSALDAVSDTIGAVAKSLGQSPNSNPLASKARHYLSSTPQAQANLTTKLNSSLLTLLRSPLGAPFRSTLPSQITATVLGTPIATPANVHNAARALSRLAVASLREDGFGQVQKDIPRIIRVLVDAIGAVQGVVRGTAPHWTDVYFDGRRRVPREVKRLLDALGEALEELVMNFGEYADSLGITKAEMKAAKELLGQNKGEMVKV